MVYDRARPLSEVLMTSLGLSTTNSPTIRVTDADRKSSQKDSQRVPQLNNRKWLELWSFSTLNLSRKQSHRKTHTEVKTSLVRVNTVLKYKIEWDLIDCWDFLVLLHVLSSFVVSVDGAEALDDGGSERDAGRAAHVLHPLHLSNAPLEDAKPHDAAEC